MSGKAGKVNKSGNEGNAGKAGKAGKAGASRLQQSWVRNIWAGTYSRDMGLGKALFTEYRACTLDLFNNND